MGRTQETNTSHGDLAWGLSLGHVQPAQEMDLGTEVTDLAKTYLTAYIGPVIMNEGAKTVTFAGVNVGPQADPTKVELTLRGLDFISAGVCDANVPPVVRDGWVVRPLSDAGLHEAREVFASAGALVVEVDAMTFEDLQRSVGAQAIRMPGTPQPSEA